MIETLENRIRELPKDIIGMLVPMLDIYKKGGINVYNNIVDDCRNNLKLTKLLFNNLDFWKMLWMRHVSLNIPKCGVFELQKKYLEAIKLYTMADISVIRDDEAEKMLDDRKIKIKEMGYEVMCNMIKSSTEWKKDYSKTSIIKCIDNGCDVNNFQDILNSPLYMAIVFNYGTDFLNYLIDNGASFNQEDLITGENVFMQIDDIELLKYALSKGAKVNYRARNGRTLLSIYVLEKTKKQKIEVIDAFIKLLLKNGANPYIKNLDGQNLFEELSTAKLSKGLKSRLTRLLSKNNYN